jgi:hypothetical protein
LTTNIARRPHLFVAAFAPVSGFIARVRLESPFASAPTPCLRRLFDLRAQIGHRTSRMRPIFDNEMIVNARVTGSRPLPATETACA